MGQLCCFPFSRGEEKISEKRAAEPDDAELVSLSKRLVENAVLKAVQQYLEETQNKPRQTDGSPMKTEEAANGNKNESDNDNCKKEPCSRLSKGSFAERDTRPVIQTESDKEAVIES